MKRSEEGDDSLHGSHVSFRAGISAPRVMELHLPGVSEQGEDQEEK